MEFAVNYSPQAADLLDAGAITIDRFKCPDWPDLIATARAYCPVYVHYDLRADPNLNGAIDWDTITALGAQTATPYINLHLGPDFAAFAGIPIDTSDPRHEAAFMDALLRGTHSVVERFGADRVIVENLPYYATAGDVKRPAVLPHVIRRVVNETGCGFLLDISHARMAAHYLGMDQHEYLAQMPCERLREVHVTGIGHTEQGVLRDHLRITDADWPYIDGVLDRIRSGEWARPWMLAFEYGGIGPLFDWRSERAVIAEQVPLLYERVKAL